MRCEAWRKYGAFQMGAPAGWQQCRNDAVVILEIEDGEDSTGQSPVCQHCKEEALQQEGTKILKELELTEALPKVGDEITFSDYKFEKQRTGTVRHVTKNGVIWVDCENRVTAYEVVKTKSGELVRIGG